MAFPRVLSAWLAVCGVALAQTGGSSFEPADFDPSQALEKHGVDVSKLDALNGFQERSPERACRAACGALDAIYGSDRVFAQDTPAYENFTGSFWSTQQEEVNPHCVFKPARNTDVSVAVLLSRLTQCPFAAKSGGHAAFKGASNSPGGISIWFKDLNEVALSDDRKVAAVGPGNNWGQVYRALEPYGLATLGGRASDIGVGGLTTGGGISYYSNQYGWVLDNVESFEVVTASGIIVTASATRHSDLYWALRGGGNNVGLVTKFNFYTIPSPKMRGGTRVWTQQYFHPVIDAFVDVVHDAPNDPYAQYYIAFLANQGINLASAELTYTKDVADPAIFKEWRSIPAVTDTVSSKTLVQQCDDIEAENPSGLREVYWPISAHLNADFAKWAVDHFFEVLPQTAGVQGANPVLIYQALTQPILANMTKYGGNTLGLSTEEGPVHLLHVACWWDNADDDDTIYQFINDYWTTVIGKAKEMGLFNEWIYMNYASKFQDVIAGYGDANKQRLQDIARRYDPRGVYQTLQPGYFKLTHAPAENPY